MDPLFRKWPLRAVLAALAVVAAAASAQTASSLDKSSGGTRQDYPARPIRFLVPFGPGGVGDITSRAVAQKLSALLGQQVIVDNRPSAGGIVATEIVAKAEPDGHTLLLLNNAHAVSATLFKSLPYDTVRDFAPISTLSTFSIVLVVSPDSPIKSVKDLIAQVKANPNKLNVGTVIIGSTQYLSAELFKSMAGLDMVTVPFNNTGAVLTALRSNNVQVAFEVLAPIIGQIKGGGVRALAVTPAARFAGLPEIPTVAESGVPGYQVTGWNGIAAPAKTPRAIIDRLNKEVTAVLAAPDLKQRFQELGVEARPSTPEAFRGFLGAEIAKWNTVIEKAKIPRQ
jgi:tripartite-type tricarboxylate transporter receptor subunit TctC